MTPNVSSSTHSVSGEQLTKRPNIQISLLLNSPAAKSKLPQQYLQPAACLFAFTLVQIRNSLQFYRTRWLLKLRSIELTDHEFLGIQYQVENS